jgi:hypothetical protein
MPHLLSLLPPQSEEEKLNPPQLVARVPSLEQSSILYVNVLGGSRSRGGIVLDPLVATGHVCAGTKVEFGQIQQLYLPTFHPPNKSVHVQLEVLSHFSQRFKPGWKTAGPTGADHMRDSGFRKQQRWDGIPEYTYNRRLDYQGTQLGLFAAGSEGGFLMGEAGIVPWLCRIRGSRAQVQVPAYKRGQARIPILSKPKMPIDPQAHLKFIERKNKLRKFLKENNLVVSKRVEFITRNRWRTVPFLRKRDLSEKSRAALAKTEILRRERLHEEEQRVAKPTVMRFARRLKTRGAKIKFRSFVSYPGQSLFSERRRSFRRKAASTLLNKPRQENSFLPSMLRRARKPGFVKFLLAKDPQVRALVQRRELRDIEFFALGSKGLTGPRRFGFRSRRFWRNYRRHGFRRHGHRPGGLKFWGITSKTKEYGLPTSDWWKCTRGGR